MDCHPLHCTLEVQTDEVTESPYVKAAHLLEDPEIVIRYTAHFKVKLIRRLSVHVVILAHSSFSMSR